MDIIVQGTGRKSFKPDQIILSINFQVKRPDYAKVLDDGARSVEVFIDRILPVLRVKKEDLKTLKFNVSELKKWVKDSDGGNQRQVFDCYVYNQSSKVTLDYNTKILSEFMEAVSRLSDALTYVIQFGLKDEEAAKNSVIAEAYNMAKARAEAIAKASEGKVLSNCIKVDFKPFTQELTSRSNVNSGDVMDKEMAADGYYGADSPRIGKVRERSAQIIEKSFTPEDIEISETLYCLWTAH